MELLDIKSSKISGKGGLDGRLGPFESERSTQGVPMFFRPALNVGDGCDSCEQSQKDEDDHSLKIVANTSRIARVVDFLKGVGEGGQERRLVVGRGIHGKTSVFYVL